MILSLLLYSGWDIRVRVQRVAIGTVTCEECAARYHYLNEKAATGYGYAPLMFRRGVAARRAKARALWRVRWLLKHEPAAVPCPLCGHYQANMLPLVRRSQYRWMRRFALVLWYLIPVLFLAAFGVFVLLVQTLFGVNLNNPNHEDLLLSLAGLGLAAAIAPGFLLHRWYKARQQAFDPNRDVPESERLAIGRMLAVVAWDSVPG